MRFAFPLVVALFLAVVTAAGATPAPVPEAAPALACAEAGPAAQTLVGAWEEDPAAAPPPVPLPCSGIRPGAPFGGGCTANWVFENTTNGDRDLYIGTAGHCTFLGHRMSIGGVPSVGVTVYDNDRGGQDFALIHIDEEDEAHVVPAMCHWGGPVKRYREGTMAEQRLERAYVSFGQGGWWFGQPALQAKRGVRLTIDGGVSFAGPASPGDSGSPIMLANGLAWGVVTHALHVGSPAVYGSGTPLDYALMDAKRVLGKEFTLVTAPLA